MLAGQMEPMLNHQHFDSQRELALSSSELAISTGFEELSTAHLVQGNRHAAGMGKQEARMSVVWTLNRFEQISNCHFRKHWTQAWKV
jgi:hypothetical protein